MTDEKRFSEEEVREILKRAMSGRQSRALAKGDGVSLSEIKAAAAEVGIDPSRIEEAAGSLTRSGGNRPNRFLGGPLVLDFERRVEGEVDREDTHEVLSAIRRITGQQGKVSEIHGSLEWSSRRDTGERYVTLAPREGATTIRASTNLSNLAVLTYIPAGAMGVIASMAGLARYLKAGSEVGLVVFFVVIPVLYLILRTIFHTVSKAESERLQQVVDELARLIGSSPER